MFHKFMKGIVCSRAWGSCEKDAVACKRSCLALCFHVLEPTDKLWIGLNDYKVKIYFEWSDGTPVTYTKWHLREPSTTNNRPENCVLIKGQVTLFNTYFTLIFKLTS